ncbi:MAG: hypothetical protein M5U26_26360 [Planctomycetota bacterium]|nr:hypothetical protein [Planctomycetota bacterium]
MGKPNWKLRIAGLIAVLFLLMVGFTFSQSGCDMARDHLRQVYKETPPEQRALHWSADYWLKLAWWEGFICGRREVANELWFEFLAIQPTDNVPFEQRLRETGMAKWNGMMDADTKNKTGWSIWHERSPETFYNYLELNSNYNSEQSISELSRLYHILFYEQYMRMTRGTRPHPKFYVFWDRVRDRYVMKWRGATPLQVLPKPADMEGPPEER